MGRPPKKLPSKSPAFTEALKFVGTILREEGSANQTHAILVNHTAVAFNGILGAGIKIDEDLYCCPQNKLLLEALSKCNGSLSITQLSKDKLSIKSDKFKAIIPCLDPSMLDLCVPDAPIISINDELKKGLEAVSILCNENSQRVVTASILMNSQSVIATDAHVIFEYWHGIENLPVGLVIPKSVVKPLMDIKKKLVLLGNSTNSITFWFEDQSWLKTQLYAEPWPNLDFILNKQSNPIKVPKDFFAALAAVSPFSEGDIFFGKGMLTSHDTEGVGASFEIEGLPVGLTFSARQLALLKDWATSIDFQAEGPREGTTMLMAFGGKMRGAIAGKVR